MFCNLGATGCCNKHGCGRDIEGMRSITAGSDNIEQVCRIVDFDLEGKLSHHFGCGSDFTDGFFLYTKTGRDHDRGHFTAHDTAEQGQHFIMKNFTMFNAS